jgi:hypothetical protein
MLRGIDCGLAAFLATGTVATAATPTSPANPRKKLRRSTFASRAALASSTVFVIKKSPYLVQLQLWSRKKNLANDGN